VAVQFLLNGTLKAHKQYADPKLTSGEDRTFDFSTRGVVASHGIKSYGNHPGTSGYRFSKAGEENLGLLGSSFNYFAAVVVAAAGADPVRKLLFMAIRAFAQRFRVQMIVGAPCTCAPF
jgi:hypothetical protein